MLRSFGNGGGSVSNRAARPERLLTVGQVAELLGTSERFPRRLIEERRIRFVRVGRHVRIPESALSEFILAGLVEPVRPRTYARKETG
jgi:excisionase family DNA binding protein